MIPASLVEYYKTCSKNYLIINWRWTIRAMSEKLIYTARSTMQERLSSPGVVSGPARVRRRHVNSTWIFNHSRQFALRISGAVNTRRQTVFADDAPTLDSDKKLLIAINFTSLASNLLRSDAECISMFKRFSTSRWIAMSHGEIIIGLYEPNKFREKLWSL